METKSCSKCKEVKSTSEFYFDSNAKKYHSRCKSCVSKYMDREKRHAASARSYQKNKEKIKLRTKLNAGQRKFREYRNKFNLSEQEYYDLLKQQDNKCCICKRDFDLGKEREVYVDHDHLKNYLNHRGLLCSHCNLLIGHAYENIQTLKNAIEYLIKWGKTE